MNITYTQLCKELEKYFGLEATNTAGGKPSSVQQFRNHVSTLNSFLHSAGKTLESRVGVELSLGFDDSVRQYLDLIDVTQRTKRDRRNHLQLVRKLHAQHSSTTCDQIANKETSLSVALRKALAKAGVAAKTLSFQVGISPSAIQRWLNGATPNQRGIPALRRLESALGMPRETLVKLIRDDDRQQVVTPSDISYRVKLKARTKDTYALPKSAISPALEREWRTLFDYKTGVVPALERNPRGSWRCIPSEAAKPHHPLAMRGQTVCPAAEIALQHLLAFLGWLTRRTDVGGWGLSIDDVQTIAWLAHPEAVGCYLEFMEHRSDGLKHNGHKVFGRFVASLVRSNTGYLAQSAALAQSLPDAYRCSAYENWERMCARTHKLAKVWIQQSNDLSRLPDAPIAGLLALEQPLSPILRAIEAIERDASACAPGGIQEARLRRDACLLALMLSNPLRLRSIQTLTWSVTNVGSVYRATSDQWRIRLGSNAFKNGAGKAGSRYDVAIASWVAEKLQAYITEYRLTLLGDKTSKYLFVSSRSPGLWKDLAQHVFRLTRRYVDGSPGFSPHAFRHLVATNWLKLYPNAYVQVAELLNDRLETVVANYSHLKRDDSFSQYNAHLDELLADLLTQQPKAKKKR